jgi:hypothetical protein
VSNVALKLRDAKICTGAVSLLRCKHCWCAVRYSFALPRKLPPSFKGVAVRFMYHIDIRAKQLNHAQVKSVSIPFRVLNPLGNISVVSDECNRLFSHQRW